MSDPAILQHLHKAIERIERGDWQGAQHNVAYAHGRMAALLGTLPAGWELDDDDE